jgi:hypothetical protein
LNENKGRKRGYEDTSEDVYRLCKRIADLWTEGEMAAFGDDIERDISAAGYIINVLHDGDVRAAIRTVDEYHRDGGSELAVVGAYSLRNVLRTYLKGRTSDGKRVINIGA